MYSLGIALSIMSTMSVAAGSSFDGQPGLQWETTSNLEEAIEYISAEIMKIGDREFIYLIGGDVNGISTTQVRFAEILSDGTLSSWQTATDVTHTSSLFGHNTAVIDQQLYVLGGDNQVLCASPAFDGSISSWKPTTSLRTELTNFATAVLDDRIYIIGGWHNNNPTSTVYSGKTTPDCGPIQWMDEPSLPISLSHAAASVVEDEFGKNFIVVVGGWITAPTAEQLIYTSAVDAQRSFSTLAGWNKSGDLGQGVMFHSLAVSGRELYVIGGTPDDEEITNLIYRFSIENEGISEIVTLELPIGIEKHDSVVGDNWQIYLIGGIRISLSQAIANYEVASLYTPLGWLAKSSSASGEVFAGDQITYTIHYTSNGLRPLTNLIITDEIPANTILIRPEYSPSTSILTWTVPSLDLNESGSVSFTVQVRPPLTAIPPSLSTSTSTPTIPSIDSGLTCSTGWSGGGGTPRPTCTPTATSIPVETTPAPTATPRPSTTRIFGLTPIPVINQAWMCEANWCIQSNPVFNAPYHFYLPLVVR